jgi:DNA-binding CsgD family transcriptional regulator
VNDETRGIVTLIGPDQSFAWTGAKAVVLDVEALSSLYGQVLRVFNACEESAQVLTQREVTVLRLICEGYATKEIAAQLSITFKTAVSHRAHIMQKAGVHDVVSLFRWAIENGYVWVQPKVARTSKPGERPAFVPIARASGSTH